MRKFRNPTFYFLLSTFYFLVFSLPAAGEVLIQRIEMKRDRGYDYLDVYATGQTEARGLLLDDKLYIDFKGVKFDPAARLEKIKSKRVAAVELSREADGAARLVITLKKKIDYDVVNVFGRDKTVIEIGDRLEDVYNFQFAWESKNLKEKGEPLKTVKLAAAAAGPLTGKTVILDPGHGGKDPGAYFEGKIPEKTLTLRLAQAAAARLREQGAAVYLTRNEDRRSNLRDVVDFVNNTGADIFISLHYNSHSDSKIGGSETYYHNPASRAFAERLHEAVVRGINRRDRGLHRVPYYTVKNAEMPSVLLEPVYVSNGEEYALASSAAFQEELARDIVKGVTAYFRNHAD